MVIFVRLWSIQPQGHKQKIDRTFMKKSIFTISLLLILSLSIIGVRAGSNSASTEQGAEHRVKSLRVLVLSTMLADAGIGEWGFAAIVEADGHRILFDTGAHPDTVLKNARELGVDLAGVKEVILSHNHSDHTGGLLHLRRELAKENPAALSRAHVGKGIFWSRPRKDKEGNTMIEVKPAYEA